MICTGLSGSGRAAHPVDAAVRPRDVDIVMKPDRPVPLRAVRIQAQCPVCGKPADEKYRPFCSKRCADIDLNRWLSGVYAVPVKEEEDEDGERVQDEGEDK